MIWRWMAVCCLQRDDIVYASSIEFIGFVLSPVVLYFIIVFFRFILGWSGDNMVYVFMGAVLCVIFGDKLAPPSSRYKIDVIWFSGEQPYIDMDVCMFPAKLMTLMFMVLLSA